MGYKNEQFFNNRQGEVDTRLSIAAKNPPFYYPDNTVRVSEFSKNEQGVSTWGPRDYKLQRGYIRTLADYAQTSQTSGSDVPIVKCNFQFNPQYITHAVPMRTNLTNVFLQSPAQMSQPIGGEVTFGFNLFFDRSYTLNNEADSFNTNELGTPGESNIGVLADLRAFYQVIGQGLSKELIEFQKRNAMMQATAQLQLGLDTYEDSEGNSLKAFDGDSAEKAIGNFYSTNVNFGNTAFLVPMPVRVVFSSLFMVDGYVTDTNVTYTKFSRTLVPMQCEVSVSMQAMYVGFAKQKTFTTVNLDEAEKEAKRDIREKTREAKDALSVLEANLDKVKVKTHSVVSSKQWNQDRTRSWDSYIDIKAVDALVVENSKITVELIKRVGVSLALTSDLNNAHPAFFVDVQEFDADTKDIKDKIKDIFDKLSVNVNMKLKTVLYGPFTESDANTLVSLEMNYPYDDATKETQLKSLRKSKISEISGNYNITTWDGWESLRKGGEFNATKTMFNKNQSNETLKQLSKQSNKFFVAVTGCSITPRVSDLTNGTINYTIDAEVAQVGNNSYISSDMSRTAEVGF